MNRIKSVILVLVCTFLLSGCVKLRTSMTINSDKSMIYENEGLFSSSLGSMTNSNIDEEAKKGYAKRGFEVEEVKDNDGYTGIKLKKIFKNIDDLSNNNGEKVDIALFYKEGFDDTKLFKLEKGFLKNKYTANFIYSVKEENETSGDENTIKDETSFSNENEEAGASSQTNDALIDSSNEQSEDENGSLTFGSNETLGDLSSLTKLMSEMEFSYKVTLPVKSDSNNATEVSEDGKTLTWKLSNEQENSIQFSFSLLNMTTIYILCGCCLLVIIVVIVIVIVGSKSKKKPVDNFTPTIVNETKEGETPINIENITSSEEVNSSIEDVNVQTASVVGNNTENLAIQQTVFPTTENTPSNDEEPILENPVENMINSVAPVQNTEPILNIEIPTIPEVPMEIKDNEIPSIPLDVEEPVENDDGVISFDVQPSEQSANPEFVMPTMTGTTQIVNENVKVENPEFVMPTMDGTTPVVEEKPTVANPEFILPTSEDASIPEIPTNE